MENGDIPNGNIVASTEWYYSYRETTYYAWLARLNGASSWAAAYSDSEPWIRADIGYETSVAGIITQGGEEVSESWVTTLKISTSTSGNEYVLIQNENGEDVVSLKL